MSDNLDMIFCPECHSEMTKVYIKEQNFHVDICLDGCGGILFDNRELKKVDEKSENAKEIFEAYGDKTYEIKNSSDVLVCSLCGQKMVKNSSSVSHNIIIDECYGCGAKFLNYGELEKIRESKKVESDDFKNAMKLISNEIEIAGFKDSELEQN